MDEERKKLIVLAAGVINIYVCAAAIEEEKKLKRKKRAMWVKPWRESRDSGGDVQKLLKEYQLFNDLQSYKSYLTMDEDCFHEILSFVKFDIERTDTKLRKCIPVEEKLAVTLRLLATGESFKELAENTKLSAAYVSQSVIEVCCAIYKNMRSTYLKFPDSRSAWLEIAENFENVWQFPNCIGALNGMHVAMTPHKHNANLFYNYKGFHSIVLLALSDAFGKFIFIDVGCNGRISDGGVYSCYVLNRVVDDDNTFPADRVIGNGRKLPYVIVADNAFPLGKRILMPYNRCNLDDEQIIYNRRLSRARQNIERAFGMLSKRFQIIQRHIPLQEDKTKVIVQACVLHNFLLENSIMYRDDEVAEEDERTQNVINNEKNNRDIRNEYKNYFCSEGKI